MVNIYDALKFAGCRLAHRESDLYVKADPLSRRVIKEAIEDRNIVNRPTLFQASDGTGLWYEIPFAYEPFWEKRRGL